ncbi:TRAP transporter substrate-binding protein DctP [Chloroflexota bacterium]
MRGGEPIGPFPYSSQYCNDIGWATWVENVTDGRLKIDIAPAGSLFPVGDTMQALSDGVVDVQAFCYTGYWAGTMPEAQIESGIPFNLSSPWDVNTLVYQYGVHDIYKEIYAEHNIVHLANYPLSPLITNTNFPVNSPDDFEGKKMRAAGYDGEMYAQMGSSPVSLPLAEIYMALKLGTVDGTAGNIMTMESNKFKEVVNGLLTNPFKYYTVSALASQDSMDKLPEDIRDIIIGGTPAVVYQTSSELHAMEELVKAQVLSEYDITTYTWSDADMQKVRVKMIENIWPKLAALSPKCAELIEAHKKFLQDFNRM